MDIKSSSSQTNIIQTKPANRLVFLWVKLMSVKHTKKPRWATNDVVNGTSGQNNVIEPSEAKKDLGWDYLEKGARNFFNWLWRQTHQWIDYFDDEINQFAPHEASTPNMTVLVDAGRLFANKVHTVQTQQTTAAFTAPTTNPRIDRIVIDDVTGVISVIAGTEAASPVAPDFVNGVLPIAQVLLATSTTEITNADITDERALFKSMPLRAVAGDWIYDSYSVSGFDATVLTKLKEWICPASGTFRFDVSISTSTVSMTVQAQIYRNGIAVGTLRSVTGTFQNSSTSEDIAGWKSGDSIELWVSNSSGVLGNGESVGVYIKHETGGLYGTK